MTIISLIMFVPHTHKIREILFRGFPIFKLSYHFIANTRYMEFKIDTKDTFTIIVPVNGTIDAKLTGEMKAKCAELAQNGTNNFIIDFTNCAEIDKKAIDDLVTLHEECYANEQSVVYTGVNRQVLAVLKENEADLLINLAPTMKEAIDIISMEILERDLFREE